MHPTRELGGPPLRSPIRACSKRGLASQCVTTPLVGSYPTFSPLPPSQRLSAEQPSHEGGVFSVPLSVGSLRLGVTQRSALWSSDFPQKDTSVSSRDHPTHSPQQPLYPILAAHSSTFTAIRSSPPYPPSIEKFHRSGELIFPSVVDDDGAYQAPDYHESELDRRDNLCPANGASRRPLGLRVPSHAGYRGRSGRLRSPRQ